MLQKTDEMNSKTDEMNSKAARNTGERCNGQKRMAFLKSELSNEAVQAELYQCFSVVRHSEEVGTDVPRNINKCTLI